jgi:hypothetical protein
MYSVALVQNQSEMLHYSYADLRPMLSPRYAYQLFTGDKIDSLPRVLSTRQVDALVLGSNALNDKDILAALCSDSFSKLLGDFVDSGRGVLSFQQLGLAKRAGPKMTVLPEPFGRVLPVALQQGDDALSSAGLQFGPGMGGHVALTYPDAVDTEQAKKWAGTFASLPGVYWHYWDDVDLVDWDPLLVDPHGGRALVLASKQSASGRVVLSALPLDWQQNQPLLSNLLAYVIEGHHHLATLQPADDAESLGYLLESLQARRVALRSYTAGRDEDVLARNIGAGIHSTVLIAPGLPREELPEGLVRTMQQAVLAGRLRVMEIGADGFGVRSLSVLSRELRPLRILELTELQIQSELRIGYIDDSFWSHVETLQTLAAMPNRVVDYGRLQDAAFAVTRNHDRNGSYDDIFGATCAYYWLRATYLGADSPEACASERWLRAKLPQYGATEHALACWTFAGLGRQDATDTEKLCTIVAALSPAAESETALMQYLRALVAVNGPVSMLAPLAEELIKRQRDGLWLDLTTTASATNVLLDCHRRLSGTDATSMIARIEAATLAAVVVILRELARSEASPKYHPYEWDGKARTTTKCLQAWLKFEELQDLPVYDLVENIDRSGDSAQQSIAHRTALTVLQTTNEQNAKLKTQARDQEALLRRAVRTVQLGSSAVILLLLAVYVLVILCVGLVSQPGVSLGDGLSSGFVSGWQYWTGIPALIAAAVGFYGVFRKWGIRSASGEGRDRRSRHREPADKS